MWGLCGHNQGSPSTTGEHGEGLMNSWMHSWWLPEMIRVIGTLWWVMRASPRPSRAFTVWGCQGFQLRDCLNKEVSMKLSLAPESTNIWRGKVSRDHWMDAGRFIQTRGLEHEHVWLTKLIFGSQARPRQLHWILSNGKEMFKRRMRGLTGGGSSHSAAGRLSLPWSLSQAISLTELLKKSVAPERLAPLYQLFIMYVFWWVTHKKAYEHGLIPTCLCCKNVEFNWVICCWVRSLA